MSVANGQRRVDKDPPNSQWTARCHQRRRTGSTRRARRAAVLILALDGLKVRRIDSEHGYFGAELTVIPSVCGDSGEIDSELARHLRLSFGQAEGKECALPDGRLSHGGVFRVLHAKPILPGASAPTGGGSRVWPLEL